MAPHRRRTDMGDPARRLAAILALGALLCLALAAPAQAGRRLALLVGVSQFADPALPELTYAGRDVDMVRSWLTDPLGGGFAAGDVTILRDDKATRGAVLAATARLAATAGPDDLVLLYFSSHGFYTQEQVVGIVCHDTRTTGQTGPQGSPIVDRTTALTRDDLYGFLNNLPARQRAMIVDACHSAELTEPPGLVLPDLAAAEDPADAPSRVTMVLASCLEAQKAWESRELGASIFTYFILEGLKANGGELVGAFQHAKRQTEQQAQCEKGWRQTPYIVMLPSGGHLILGPLPEG
ncbi:MAG: caspase family protein [Thermodesulfobacteriota bacterium]